MKRIFILISMFVLSLALILAVATDRSPAVLAQDNQPSAASPQDGEIQDYPARQISYQGKLVINGDPCQGEIKLTFKLYTEAFFGTPIWTETQNVTCDMGIFSTRLGKVTPLPYADRFQNLLLLGITPEGADHELFPRVMLTAAPYAMSLLPGATMVDSESDADYIYSLKVNSYYRSAFNATTSVANGAGVTGIADGPAESGAYPKGVYGFSEAGYGVYGASEDHTGVYGAGETGVRGDANTLNGFGVYGDAGSFDDAIGVIGSSTGEGAYAVLGQSSGYQSHGVYGTASGIEGAGVYGIAMDDTLCGEYDDCNGGVVGKALGGGAQGVFGYSFNQSGIYASNRSLDKYTGFLVNINGTDYPALGVLGSAKFYGYVTFTAGKSGYVVDVALNAGSEPLQRGDVVVVTGMDAPVIGEIPVMRVEKATPESASGIVGIVDVLYEHYGQNAADSAPNQAEGRFNTAVTTIQPGEYLSVVTLGAYQWLKVDATSTPIHAGDLLSISSTAGVAAKAQQITIDGYSFYAPGTIIGKALQDLDAGTGYIAVFVSLK